MMDAIRSMGSAAATPVSPVTPTNGPVAAATPQPAPTPKAPSPQADAASSAGSLAKALAASPPVDKDRVAQIKRAIQTGTFPILPATIADRLIALKYEWSGREPQ